MNNNNNRMSKGFIVLDFETNGAKLPNGKMDEAGQLPTEVVAIRVIDGEVTSIFNTLIYYDHVKHGWTDYLASPNNSHTQEDLLKGMSESAVVNMLHYFINDHDIIVAYNALFDLRVLDSMRKRCAYGQGLPNAFLDPLTIAREMYPYPHKLEDTCKHYGITIENAHVAMDDGLALVNLVLAMDEMGTNLDSWIDVAGYKRQYGAPTWLPHHGSVKLHPQGNESFTVKPDGSTIHGIGAPPSPSRPKLSSRTVRKP